jgi:hypothetical protein
LKTIDILAIGGKDSSINADSGLDYLETKTMARDKADLGTDYFEDDDALKVNVYRVNLLLRESTK